MENFATHPRVITALYAISLGSLACLLTLSLFKCIGLGGLLPTLPSIALTVLLAGTFGALFGGRLRVNQSKKGSFLLGVLFLVTVLPFYDLGALFFIKKQFNGTGVLHQTVKDNIYLYGLILVYSFIFVGSWLSIFCGFASMFLQKLFSSSKTV